MKTRWDRLLFFVLFFSVTSFADSVLIPPTSGVYLGVYAAYDESSSATLTTALNDFTADAARSAVWDIVLSEWGQALQFPTDDAMAVHQVGSTPFVRILPRSVPTETDAIDPVLKLDVILRGDFDDQIRDWAQGAKALGFPILAEFGPEPNGFWNQWSGIYYPNGPALYASVVQHVITICRAEGATNITWFFHMNGNDNPAESTNQMAQYYPGDSYIDWIGVSVMGAQQDSDYWDEFVAVMDPAYAEISTVTPNKPIALVETGVIEDPHDPSRKANWISNAYQVLKTNRWPRLKAYSYWNEKMGTEATEIDDLSITSSPAALAAFKSMVSDLFFVSAPVWGNR